MKAITIRAPWSEAVARGAKFVENRTAGSLHRGPIAIHAGLQTDHDGLHDWRIRRLLGDDPTAWPELVTGAVIAVARLVDVHVAVRPPGSYSYCCPPWGDGWRGHQQAVHLVLADVVRLPEPIPARGQLGIWTWHNAPTEPEWWRSCRTAN